ncbi:MAG TPA: ATP-binding protein [Acidimicrobiales bacterium]|nr:ATP-binding protein [Acidimicrobiales bacterium]
MCCEVVIRAGVALEPPAADACSHLELKPDPKAPKQARAFVADHLPDIDEDTADTIALLVSELVTNAVLHARTALEVGVSRSADEVLVSVGDLVETHPQPDSQAEDGLGGRGLTLLRGLSHRWGVHSYETGKSVWFTMLAAAPSGAGQG